ncbi:MAG: hypothetical protein CVU05_02095 [Bacteroidetes bacterium HGW-Bacteroidetes-21]|jgi:hypothetical protein|nr:MAG: hypothetical protein CVU05_02095 [Bacteroidetes bacterium HGW-Bacteroidetes-21]
MKSLIISVVFSVFTLSFFAQNQAWDAQFIPANSTNNTVYCIIQNGPMDFYVSGTFTQAGGNTANYIARWDGSVWTTLGTGFDGPVYALTLWSNNLIAGGLFTQAGGSPASNLAVWDGSSWAAMGTGTNGIVRTLEFFDPYLYVGGEFTDANGTTVSNIFRTNGTAWENMHGGTNGPVYDIDIRNFVIIGGAFTQAGAGVNALNVASWNGTVWSNLADGLNDTVRTVQFTPNGIYAGGAFTMSGTTPCNRVALWDAGMWKPLGAGFDNTVYSLTVEDTLIYAGGLFQNSGSTSINHIARYSNASWFALGDGTNASVRTTCLDGYDVYCGGAFTQTGTHPSNYFGRWGSVPVIEYQPEQLTLCAGDLLEIGLDIWSSETVSYVWKKDGVTLAVPDNDTLTIASATAIDAGLYTCEMTNIFGNTITTQIAVVVHSLPTFILTPTDAEQCENTALLWQANVTSSIPITYTWIQGSTPISGITIPELNFSSLETSDAGIWHIDAENACGIISSSTFTLTVNALPIVTISGMQATYCYTGQNDTVEVSPAGGTLIGPNLNGNIFTPYGLVGNPTFTYTYTDINSCTNTASFTTHIFNPNPVTLSGYEVFYCLSAPNDTIQGTPAGGYFTGDIINDSIFSPATAGEGTFHVSYYYIDANNCVNADTVEIVVMQQVAFTYPDLKTKFCDNEEPYNIVVFPPSGTFSGPGISGHDFNPIIAGQGVHTITYTFIDPWGCSGTDNIILTVFNVTPASFTGLPTEMCNNATQIPLTGLPTGGEFIGDGMTDTIFNPADVQPGIIPVYYIFTDENDCIDTAHSTVNVLPVAEAFFTGLSPFYCQNELQDTLDGIPSGGVFSGTGVTGNIFSPYNAGEGNHTIIYSFLNANGCTSYDSVTITVDVNPDVFIGSDHEICNGEEISITATYNTNDDLYWNTGDVTPTITLTPPLSTLIIATVFNGVCFNSDTAEVIVHALPDFTLGADISACNTATLAPSSTFSQYHWSNNSSAASLVVTQSNTYSITVTDNNSCTNSDTVEVEILPGPIVELGVNRVITENQSITFIVDQGYDTYLWSDGSSTHSLLFSGSDYGVGNFTVWVLAENDNGCFDMDTVIVTVNPGIYADFADADFGAYAFPNPVHDKLHFEIPENLAIDEIKIYDITGRQMYLSTNQQNNFNAGVDVSQWIKGLYLVYFYVNNTCYIQKIAVN